MARAPRRRAPPHLFDARRPHFLVAAAPKTGSTWLADNLRLHPGVFVPAEKELRYFSSLGRWADLGWYLSRFAGGEGRVRGEASPSYAALPPERIRLIRELFPDVRIVFLLREPVSRAWSHTRHGCRHAEAYFNEHPAARVDDPAIDWAAAATHEWVTANGDYLGHLRRWLAVFPKEQVLVRFFDDIEARPEALLREVLAFIGGDASVPLDGFPLRERINPGMEVALPPEAGDLLRRLWSGRTRELAAFLGREFGLALPSAWGVVVEDALTSPVFAPAFERRLGEVLALEETFPASGRELYAGRDGFRVTLEGRRLVARDDAGTVLEACSLAEIDRRIAAHRLARTAAVAEAALARAAALEHSLRDMGRTVQHLELQVERLRPWYRGVGRWLMDAWRRAPAGQGASAVVR